jgi:MFS family permease
VVGGRGVTGAGPQGRWDRLTVGLAVSYVLLSWSLGFGAVLPSLRDEVPMSATVASLHGAMFGFGLLAVGTTGATVLARVGRRVPWLVAIVAMAVGAVVVSVGRSAPVTLAGAVASGAGAAVLVLLGPGLVADRHGDDRDAVMAVVNVFPMLAALGLPLAVAVALALDVGWRPVLGVPAVVTGVVAAVLVAGAAMPGFSAPASAAGTARWWRVGPVRRRWLTLAAGTLVDVGLGLWAASLLREVGGASEAAAAGLVAVLFTAMAVSRALTAGLARRFGAGPVLVGGLAVALVGFGPLLVGPGLVGRVVGLGVIGLGIAPLYPLAVSRLFDAGLGSARASVAGALASGVGITVGPILLGVLGDAVGLRWASAVLPVVLVGVLVAAAEGRGRTA